MTSETERRAGSYHTAERLRSDIDRERTGEKVPGPDPAAAPLGGDEEAAGTPLAPQAVETARTHELRGPETEQNRQKGLGAAWILVAVIALFAIVATGAWFVATRT